MTRRTLAREISTDGTALHCGARIRMTLSPAPPGSGVVFRRTDLGGLDVAARYDKVCETHLGTVIREGEASVAVVEHLMAAVAGTGIDDLLVTLDGPEPPILDGDALGYVVLIEEAGIKEQPGHRTAIQVLKRVQVGESETAAALSPSDAAVFDFEIEFSSAIVGRQEFRWPFSHEGFRREIAPARTFGFVHEFDALNKAGLARGASLENTLALDGDALVNPKLMRFPDEFVRHKILDALGDIALAGAPVIGRFEGRRSGHTQNNALLRALFADPANYAEIDAP